MTETTALIAGRGPLPGVIAEAWRARDKPLKVIGFDGHSDPALARFDVAWFQKFQLGKLLKNLRAQGISKLAIAGNFDRVSSWQALINNLDLLPKALQYRRIKSKGDGALTLWLRHVIEAEGFEVLGLDEMMGDRVARLGMEAGAPLSASERADVARGFELLAVLGEFDVGQALVIEGERILAVEGAEGTDRMLHRAAELRTAGLAGKEMGAASFLLKAAKPQQSLQDDMPVVGRRTLEACRQAGLDGMIVEADRVMLTEGEGICAEANNLGLRFAVFKPGD